MVRGKQKKVSIPDNEMELAKEQASKEGFGDNVTGYIRWVIRSKSGVEAKKQVEAEA